ncbi:MAG TPA: hypothetical protein VHB79_10760 [Polyangiaceae bacterium]|nr:hypothetical protein [Polyangiaceae bacterium]
MIGIAPLLTAITQGPQGPAGSDSGVLTWNGSQAAANTSDNFLPTYAAVPDTNEYKSGQLIATATTLTTIRVASFTVLGSSNTITFTLRKNGVDTGLTVTLGVGATSAVATGSVSVAPGDMLTMKAVQSGNGTAGAWGLVVAVSP